MPTGTGIADSATTGPEQGVLGGDVYEVGHTVARSTDRPASDGWTAEATATPAASTTTATATGNGGRWRWRQQPVDARRRAHGQRDEQRVVRSSRGRTSRRGTPGRRPRPGNERRQEEARVRRPPRPRRLLSRPTVGPRDTGRPQVVELTAPRWPSWRPPLAVAPLSSSGERATGNPPDPEQVTTRPAAVRHRPCPGGAVASAGAGITIHAAAAPVGGNRGPAGEGRRRPTRHRAQVGGPAGGGPLATARAATATGRLVTVCRDIDP